MSTSQTILSRLSKKWKCKQTTSLIDNKSYNMLVSAGKTAHALRNQAKIESEVV